MSCVVGLLVVASVAGFLVTREIKATPLRVGVQIEEGESLAARPLRSRIPNPDTSQMDANVRERLDRARAEVLGAIDSAEAWGTFGAACDAHKLFSCAETCYRQAMALAPREFRFPYLLGILLDARGHAAEETLQLFDRVAALAPDFALVPYRRGDVLVRQGRTDEAAASYERAIKLNDRLAIAHRSLGQLLLSEGSSERAIQHLNSAALLEPNDSVVHTALAQAYASLGDRDRAEESLRRSRALDPVVVAPDPLRAGVYAMATGSPLVYSRAKDNYYKGRYAESISDFLVVSRARPNDPLVQVYIGSSYRRIDEFGRAEEHLRKALDIDPNCLPALSDLGFLLMNQKRLDEAVTCFRKADGLEPNHPMINKRLGNVLVWQGKFEEAIRRFEASAKARPASARMHVNWGIALRESGGLEDAVYHLELAVQMEPGFAPAHEQLGLTWEALGDPSRAAEAYRTATQIDPANPAASRLASLDPYLQEP